LIIKAISEVILLLLLRLNREPVSVVVEELLLCPYLRLYGTVKIICLLLLGEELLLLVLLGNELIVELLRSLLNLLLSSKAFLLWFSIIPGKNLLELSQCLT